MIRTAQRNGTLKEEFGSHTDVLNMVFDDLKLPDDTKTQVNIDCANANSSTLVDAHLRFQ